MNMRLLPLLLASVASSLGDVPAEDAAKIRTLLRERKVAEAESAANALVAAHAVEPEAHALLGSVRLAKGEGEAAVKACEKAVELAPKSGEFQRQLGDAYGFTAQHASAFSKFGWGKKCLAAYEKAVALEPANLAARSSLMQFYQQAPGIAGGSMEKAFQQAAMIKQQDAVRGALAYASLYAGDKKYAQAFMELEDCLKRAPDDYPVLYQIGRLAAMSGERVERGIETLNKCLSLTPPSTGPGYESVQWRLGNLWEKKGDRKAARAAYQAALAVNPGYQPAVDALKKLN